MIRNLMKVLSNLFGNNTKISASDIAIKNLSNNDNGKSKTLDEYLAEDCIDVYSIDERIIGRWKDNKPIYRKTIDCGALPNNCGNIIPHNILNVDNIVKIYGWSKRQTDNVFLPLPHNAYNNTSVSLYASKDGITIVTYTDRASFSETYVTLEYTKTTD